ncbi:MAG: hypothetical protein EHM28_14570 [Spirochaetaceae bacterium]|nr:MAG: hypothetical protein EHM28_14570 [Spirochaetaceae bacterium]
MKNQIISIMPERTKYLIHILAFIVSLAFLILARILYSFLLFHFLVETFAVVVAFSIFLFGWNTYENLNNGFFKVVGISFLFIGALTILHTATYYGM